MIYLKKLIMIHSNLKQKSSTVGGWVLEQFQKLPQQGESFTQAGLKVTVQQLNQQRITSLLIEKLQVVKEEDY